MPNVNKVIYGNQTLIDLTNSTLSSAGQLAQGVTAYDRGGNLLTGTASGGTSAISVVDTSDSHGGTVRTITALDISDTTAVASDVAQGKYFYTADGTKTQGTSSGGGDTNPTASPKDVNFIDYDGTVRYSYTASEAQALTELPANPSHSGLTAQGWNWTLAQIKSQLTNVGGKVWVGQMYITQSGDTEIDLVMQKGRLSPTLTIAVNGVVTVDWGDNTTANTVTGSSLTTRKAVQHTYSSTGSYTMKIHVVSGSFTFYGSTSYTLLRKNTTANENRVYSNCIQAIRIGSGVTSIGNYAFYFCSSLASITIPSGVTSIGNNAFYYCYSLASITIPSEVTSIGNSAFSTCSSLTSITIPSGVTSIGTGVFATCSSLASITIPSGVTSIGSSAFNSCSSLASITIPSGVTSIETSVFSNCSSLASITIPSGVTSIGSGLFSSCYGMAEYHVLPTTPPTLGAAAFNNITTDCIIYVPSASLSDYQAAQNWSTYASYMRGE